MGHFATYTFELKYEKKTHRLYYLTTAHVNTKKVKKSAVVQKIYEDGESFERYLHLTSGGGYCVYLPNEKLPYCCEAVKKQKMYQVINKCNLWMTVGVIDYDFINSVKPEYRYLNKKILSTGHYIGIDGIFAIYRAYKEHPYETEMLISKGKVELAVSKKLYLLSVEKKQQIINFVRRDTTMGDWSINDVLKALKKKCKTMDELRELEEKEEEKIGKYIEEQNENAWFYHDYLKLCKQAKKDTNDKYWKFPKDLREAHNKLQKEIQAKADESYDEKLKKAVKSIGGQHLVTNGKYTIYIPEDMKDIRNQAKALSQCLITCDYYKKMANGNCILIFIKNKDKPVATAEINKSKEIIQFYANEVSREKCKPSKAVNDVLKTYLKELKLKGERKNEQNKKH